MGLKGLKTRAKPTGRPAQVERCVRWVHSLRPGLNEEQATRHATSSKRWAICLYHFPTEGSGEVGDQDPPLPGRGKTVQGSPALPARTAAQREAAAAPRVLQAPIPSAPRLPPTKSPSEEEFSPTPSRGDRLAVRIGDEWIGGVVRTVEVQLSDSRHVPLTTIDVTYDDGVRRPAIPAGSGYRVLVSPAPSPPTATNAAARTPPMAGHKRVPGTAYGPAPAAQPGSGTDAHQARRPRAAHAQTPSPAQGSPPPAEERQEGDMEAVVRELLAELTLLRRTLADKEAENLELTESIQKHQERSRRPLTIEAFEQDPFLSKAFGGLSFFSTPKELRLFYDLCCAFCPMERLQYFNGASSVESPIERNADDEKKKGGRPPTLPPVDQLLFTLIHMRAIPNINTLSGLFHIPESVGSMYFSTWVRLLEELLLELSPLDAAVIQRLHDEQPAVFNQTFKGRFVPTTLDCLHWETQSASDPQSKKVLFSKYWNSAAGKVLIALASLGAVLPPSRVHGGSITDPEITDAWETLACYPPGTHILADKGWVDYTTALTKHALVMITPDKKRVGAEQFTADDSLWNQHVAYLRIHVERVIRRIREFRILNSKMPLARRDVMTPVMTVCALLTNFRAPTGGREMDLHTLDGQGNPIRVSAYTLLWGPSVLGWRVPTPARGKGPTGGANAAGRNRSAN